MMMDFRFKSDNMLVELTAPNIDIATLAVILWLRPHNKPYCVTSDYQSQYLSLYDDSDPVKKQRLEDIFKDQDIIDEINKSIETMEKI